MGYRILIVEDSDATRSLIASALELDPEFDITETASGLQALQALPRGAFDLIITDINMPDINGFELVRFIKANPLYKATPLIILSSVGNDEDRERGIRLGADEYVVKPFQPDALVAIARTHLERAAGL